MGIRQLPSSRLDLVSIDNLVDMPTTARGNKHILRINDHFSKFSQLYPVKDRTVLNAIRPLTDFFMKFVIP